MASRREEKERLRQQRLAMEQQASASARQRLVLGYVAAGILTLAVVAGLIAVIASSGGGGSGEANPAAHIDPTTGSTLDLQADERDGAELPEIEIGDLEASAKAAGCQLRTNLPDEGNTHIPPDAPDPKYKTNPPTSGDHDPTPLADGAYLETPPKRNALHSLEHGRVNIHYSPDLPEGDQLLLKGLLDLTPDYLLLFPNPEIPGAVAVANWTNLLTCRGWDDATLDAVRNFSDSFREVGPENAGPGEPGP